MIVLYVDDDCLVLETVMREEILIHAQALFRSSGDVIEEQRGKRLVRMQLTFFREALTNAPEKSPLRDPAGDEQLELHPAGDT